MAELMSNDGVDKATKLRTLEAIQKNFRENNEAFDNEETELDSDDDEDLSSRLEGIDLEDTDKVWSLLTSEGNLILRFFLIKFSISRIFVTVFFF